MHNKDEIINRNVITQHATSTSNESKKSPLPPKIVNIKYHEAVNLLLGFEIDVNQENDRGETALHDASKIDRPDTVELRFNGHEGNIDACNNFNGNKKPPQRFMAFIMGSYEAVKLLLDCGANSNHPNYKGETALHFACEAGRFYAAKLLLDYGAKINQPNDKEETALHLAARTGESKIVELLLNHPKIDINRRNGNGETALHVAFRADRFNIMSILLKRDEINTNLKDNNEMGVIEHIHEKINRPCMNRENSENSENGGNCGHCKYEVPEEIIVHLLKLTPKPEEKSPTQRMEFNAAPNNRQPIILSPSSSFYKVPKRARPEPEPPEQSAAKKQKISNTSDAKQDPQLTTPRLPS